MVSFYNLLLNVMLIKMQVPLNVGPFSNILKILAHV